MAKGAQVPTLKKLKSVLFRRPNIKKCASPHTLYSIPQSYKVVKDELQYLLKIIPLVQSNFIAEIERAVLQIVLQITYTNCTAKWRNFQNFAKKQGNSEESAMVSKCFKSPLKFK